MKKQILVLALVITLILSFPIILRTNATSTMLYTSPNPIQKTYGDIGNTFTVSVNIAQVTDLYGFDINVTWDSQLITFQSAAYSSYLNTIWGSGNWALIFENYTASSYRLIALATGLSSGFTTSGSQALFTLILTVQDPHTNSMRQCSLHFDTDKLSDSNAVPIDHTTTDGTYSIQGQTPTLNMTPTARTCRMFGETFNVNVTIPNAANVTGLDFEIHYNTTLLNCVNVVWTAWGSGTETIQHGSGIVNGSTSGNSLSGNLYLVELTFNSAFYRIWKNIAGWQNDVTDTNAVYIQAANLTYPSPQPQLAYVRGGPQQGITIGQNVTYTFSPIQGDINNDGQVTIGDIRTVAYFYGVKQGDPQWGIAQPYDLTDPYLPPIIDLFDLVLIARNFGYVYTPPPP